MNRDLWAILSDKSSGEALDKIKSVPKNKYDGTSKITNHEQQVYFPINF